MSNDLREILLKTDEEEIREKLSQDYYTPEAKEIALEVLEYKIKNPNPPKVDPPISKIHKTLALIVILSIMGLLFFFIKARKPIIENLEKEMPVYMQERLEKKQERLEKNFE